MGPVLATLRQFESVRGLVFGTYAESSRDVARLMEIAAEMGAGAGWREMGSRTEQEARGFLVAYLRRRWGTAAAIAQARMRLARLPYVGRTHAEARAMGSVAGADAATNHLISPTAVEADAADIGRRRQAQGDTRVRGRSTCGGVSVSLTYMCTSIVCSLACAHRSIALDEDQYAPPVPASVSLSHELRF